MDMEDITAQLVADEDLLQVVLLLEGQQTGPEEEELVLYPEGAGHQLTGQAG